MSKQSLPEQKTLDMKRLHSWIYTVMGLHAQVDILEKHSVYDGQAIKKDIESMYEELKRLYEVEKEYIMQGQQMDEVLSRLAKLESRNYELANENKKLKDSQ